MRARDYTIRLERAGISNSQQESLWLMSYALGVSTSQILARDVFTNEETAKIERVIARRERGEPLQYIMFESDFFGRDFHVGSGVLIPRRDTETLIYAVMKHFAREESFSFIDWGTGSGCIAITIMLEFPKAYAYLIENSPHAADYARMNLERYSLTSRAQLLQTTQTLTQCRLLISNPPYIPSRKIDGLMKSVRDYEPHSALDGGHDGMKYYLEILSEAERLKCEYVILETGNMNQVQSLKASSTKFACIDEVHDDNNFPRCLVLRRRTDDEETCC